MRTYFSNKLFLCVAALAVGVLSETMVRAQPGGVPLWTNRYNGPGNSSDYARGLAVDGSGNVIVVGYSMGNGSGYDYATIKYSSAGLPLWTNRYNGPGNGTDQAGGVAVDGNGNVFITGSSSGSGSGLDYATVAYSSAGVPLWTNRYNGPGNGGDRAGGVAVDGSGNVFVTGHSTGNGSGLDFVTIAYSDAGVPLWTNRYNGPGNGLDTPGGFTLDSSSNVFVTGASVGSGSDYDYATVAYSSAGVALWTNRYNGPGYSDVAVGVAVDGNGNLLVTGSSYETNGNSYYATIKYSSAGVPLWTNRYEGPGNGSDVAGGVAVDGSGYVFVTGASYGTNGNFDYATIKYSSAGVPLWTNRYEGQGNSYDQAHALAVDGSGNIFVTGQSFGSGSDDDYATVAYSSAGVPLWTNRYNGLGNGEDRATTLAVDGRGNVYVTGYSIGSGTGYDYVTIKYSSTGPLLTIARTATNTLAFSWPSPAADFVLQQNTNVATTNWTAVGIAPADDGTNKTVIIAPPERNRFYRLFRP